jgi:spore maturation protein CgeB
LNDRGIIKYQLFQGREQTWDDYIRNLNRSWLSYCSIQNTDLSYYKNYYIGCCFSRNLEICGCKAGLINRRFGDAEKMGFKDGVNCILYEDIKEFPSKLKYHLDNKDKLKDIIEKGYELVHSRHTVTNHIRSLIEGIERIL